MKQAKESLQARDEMATRSWETLFLADWIDFAFLHYAVDRGKLQEVVPFPLDLHEGQAYVSLVAFTMRDMRFARGGRATRWMTAPFATHSFLNLRTYVREGDMRGIYFMKEWMNNRIALPLGPRTFGLPYHLGRLDYANGEPGVRGDVNCREGYLRYSGEVKADALSDEKNSLEKFLLERYVAFASAGRNRKYFRVWHKPWKTRPIENLQISENTLFDGLNEEWTETADLASAQQSPGVENVWMGRPHRVYDGKERGFLPQFGCKGPKTADSCGRWKTTLSERMT